MDITPRSSANEPDTSQNQSKQPDQAASPPPQPVQPATPEQHTTQGDVSSAEPSQTPPVAEEPKPFTMDNPTQGAPTDTANRTDPVSAAQPEQPAPTPANNPNFSVEEAMKASPAPSAAPQSSPESATPAAKTNAPSQTPASPPNSQAQVGSTETTEPSTAAKPPQQPPADNAAQPAAAASTAPAAGSPGGKKRSKLPWIVGIITAIIVLTAAFVFGYYLPNQPESVYRTGLDRSGEVLQELSTELTKTEKIEQFSQSAITASLDFSGAGVEASGSFDSRLDEARSDNTLEVSYGPDEEEQQALNVQVMTDIVDGSQFPDVFVNFRGISQLGLDAYLPNVNQYDDQWIHISAAFLEESFSGTDVELNPSERKLTAEDYAEFVSTVTTVTNEYVFTSDSDTAIFENQEYVADEDINGVSTYKYTVDINSDNLLAYCQQLQERSLRTEAYSKLSGQDETAIDSEIDEQRKQCESTIEDFVSEIDSVEMWVDRSHKLVHQIRFHSSSEGGYLDIGQIYNGGDDVTFFVGTHVEEDNETTQMRLEATTNLDSLKTDAEMTASETGDNGFELTATLSAEPAEGDVEIERPTDTIDFETFLDELLGGAFAQPEPQSTQSENFQGEVEFEQSQSSDDSLLQTFTNFL